ncbi:putative protein phosphatase 2C 5 [Platanthera guangdongensis]|uniref:protein-serine/threonine phosphatase n=1 Tax=Platanthera guangdongensis TaxID=2320717 RepID=A0ABR2MUY2_9ASPA
MALLSLPSPQRPLRFGGGVSACRRLTRRWCSAVTVDAASPPADGISGIRWGSSTLQGAGSEMEDEVALRSDGIFGFTFAAVFDGHAGISSVMFLRDELYKECVNSLQGGILLSIKNFNAVNDALTKAFENVDGRLVTWLEQVQNGDESGTTATVTLLGHDALIISHVGDSQVVLFLYF